MARLPHLQGRYLPPEETKAASGSVTPPEPYSRPVSAAPQTATSAQSRPNADLAPRPTSRFDTHAGVYVPKGEADPHVYSEFRVREERISSPRILRLTTPYVLLDSGTQASTALPMACIWQPLAESPAGEPDIPVIDVTKKGPFRCSRCLAYSNPFFVSYDGSRTLTCNICGLAQPAPLEFVSDRESHVEFSVGTYDFLVPSDYSQKPPQVNVFLLCIDVSSNALAHGLPQSVLSSLKSSLSYIPAPERSRVLVMTYSDVFTFYLPSAHLQEIIVRETEDPFVPFPVAGLAFALDTQKEEFEQFIEALSEKISAVQKPANELIAPGAVVTAAKEALGETGGRVLLFTTGLGTIGLMKLTMRDDSKLYNTDKERDLYLPQTDSIYDLARDCSAAGITIDVFACALQAYLDISSLYPLVTITGGDLHYYPRYVPQDAEKLHFTLVRTLTRPQVFQVMMRVRCSSGVSVEEYIGHFNRKGATDMEVAVLDADKAFAVLLKHDEKLKEGAEHHIQCAMLYTNLYGQRLIRVSNTIFHSTGIESNVYLDSVYQFADVNAVHNVLMKKSLMKMLDLPLRNIREQWHAAIVSFLMHFRVRGKHQTPQGQIAFPETMNVLPLLTIATMKTPAFSLSRVGPDARMAAVAKLKGMSVLTSFLLSYPRIYSVHDLAAQTQSPGAAGEDGLIALPTLVPAAGSKLGKNGAYLIDNGEVLYLYVGAEVSTEFLTDVRRSQVFNVTTINEVEVGTTLPQLDTDLSQRLQAVISELHRKNPGAYQSLIVLPDTSQAYFLSSAFATVKPLLVEDSTPSEMSYGDYLLNLNRVLLSKMENR